MLVTIHTEGLALGVPSEGRRIDLVECPLSSPVGNTYAPVRTAFDELDVCFRASFWHRALELGLGMTRWAPTGFPVEIGPDALIAWRVNFHE